MAILEIRNLKKKYGSDTTALKGIDLKVEKGDFYGLLGPNGAGKSTTIGIITGLVNKTSGRVIVDGHDIDKAFSKAKRTIGIVPQEMNFGIFEKVLDIVVNQAGYYGIPRKKARINAEKYLKQLELWEKKDEQAKNLSGGMKRRLMIARALVHEPKMLILDEPTAGVDVKLRRGMYTFLRELNKKGITIILTTHYLEEAEELCNKIGIIDKGTIIQNTSKRNFLEQLDQETFVFNLKNPIKKCPKSKNCNYRLIDSRTIEVDVKKDEDVNQVFKNFEKKGIKVLSMRNKVNRLEELFVKLTEDKK